MYTIYSKPGCSYCVKAKKLLERNKLEFKELVLDTGITDRDPSVTYYKLDELKSLVPGVRTVPQIFKGGKLLGGFEDLEKSLKSES